MHYINLYYITLHYITDLCLMIKMTASMKLPLTMPNTTPMPTMNSTPPAIEHHNSRRVQTYVNAKICHSDVVSRRTGSNVCKNKERKMCWTGQQGRRPALIDAHRLYYRVNSENNQSNEKFRDFNFSLKPVTVWPMKQRCQEGSSKH